ncbi:MAG: DUF447 family protein, partial [Thermococcus sp.]|nr:DUF447 family protein [Thermococcus sp.]
ERRVERWRDSLGETEVLLCELTPEGEIDGELPLRPFSRADCILVEMAVLFTRYRVKSEKSLKEEILKMYSLYTYLGGTSPTARHIVELLTKESQTE